MTILSEERRPILGLVVTSDENGSRRKGRGGRTLCATMGLGAAIAAAALVTRAIVVGGGAAASPALDSTIGSTKSLWSRPVGNITKATWACSDPVAARQWFMHYLPTQKAKVTG